jgi:ankyrin repeat protein
LLLESDYGTFLVQKRDNKGFTPLHKAASNGHLEVVRQLYNKGANVDSSTHNQQRPIHLAAKEGHTIIIQYLIAKDCHQIVVQDTLFGDTPLHLAVKSNHVETAKKLIKLGASLEAVNEEFETPMLASTYVHATQCVELLIKVIHYNKTENPYSPQWGK